MAETDSQSDTRAPGQSSSPTNSTTSSTAYHTVVTQSVDGTPVTHYSDAQAAQMAAHNETLAQFVKPQFARAPITEAGRVAYLGMTISRICIPTPSNTPQAN